MWQQSEHFYTRLLCSILLVMSSACGDNLLKDLTTVDAIEEATKELEDRNPDAAIDILLDALGDNFTTIYKTMATTTSDGSYLYSTSEAQELFRTEIDTLIAGGTTKVPAMVSVLSAAHGQKYGIDAFDIALSLATNDSSDDDNTIMALYSVLPAASEANIRGLNEATAVLSALDTAMPVSPRPR